MYQEDEPSLVEHGQGQFYSVNKLLQLSRQEPIVFLKVAEIGSPHSTKKSIQTDRIGRANPDIPILVYMQGDGTCVVLDGIHRLWKARHGTTPRDTIAARILTPTMLDTARLSRICAYCFNLAAPESYDSNHRVYCLEHARLIHCSQ